MQQFIDKLISRLEERRKSHEEALRLYVDGKYGNFARQEEKQIEELECICEIVNQLAEEYKGGWIPCSVELPKYMERAITCDEKGNIHVFICDGKYFLDEFCKRITENHERYYVPIAWQYLPSPYQKEGEEI